ncbi:MAG: mevalonate kinase, partial [Elusimicrobiota bacterium]
PEKPLYLVVGDTGIRHQTVEVVADVRKARETDTKKYDEIFAEIGKITLKGVRAFKKSDGCTLGKAMNENQGRLAAIGVSSREIDALISAALGAGALGAKLCGAGRGGCIAALASSPAAAERIRGAVKSAGAEAAFTTTVLGQEKKVCARS